MTRLPLATDLKTRIGAPSTKDARQVNSYVEVKGDQTVVRKRPAAQGGLAIGTGTAQGGIGLTINGTPYFIGFWGDTMQTYTGSGTSWSSGASYVIGDHVSVDFVDYWALADNTNSQPPSANWSRSYVPAVPIVITYATWNPVDKGSQIVLSNGNLTTRLYGMVRSTISKTSGKWYWEVHVDNNVAVDPGFSNLITIGAANSNAVLANFLGNDTDGWGYSQGQLLWNGSSSAYGANYTNLDVIGVALNMDAGTLTYYKNGVSQGVAASGLTGPIFAAIGGTATPHPANDIYATTNFGASAFTYTPPVGFNSGLYS